jgi:hypothetical protein
MSRTNERNATRNLIDRDTGENIKTRRWGVYENFQNLPLLNADYAATTPLVIAEIALLTRGNPNYEIVGVNAASADDIGYSPHGGVNLTTAANDNDSTILRPQADTLHTCLHETSGVNFGTEDQTWFDTNVRFDQIANMTFFAGLKLTDAAALATPATIIAADDDAAFVMFSTGGATSTTNFTGVASVGGTDVEQDLNVEVAIDTDYRIQVNIDQYRRAGFYVNGVALWNSPQLTNDIDLIPICGVLAEGATAQDIHVRYIDISRLLAVN